MVSALTCQPRRLITCVFLAVLALASSAFAAPITPTNLTTSYTNANSSVQVWRFSWTDNSTDETGFRIYYRVGSPGSSASLLTTVDVPADIKTATGPLSYPLQLPSNAFGTGSFVQFFMSAYNASGESSGTNVVTISPWPGPQTPSLIAPSGLGVTPIGDGSFRVTFADNSNSEQYFELDYKKSTESTWTATGIDFNTTTIDVGGYRPRSFGPDTVEDPANDPTPDDELMFLPNFQPGTAYDFKLRAVDYGNNVSAFTSVVSATSQPFKAPSGLTATRLGENTFDLVFVNNSTADSGYQFQYRAQGTSTWSDLGMVDNPFFNTINTGPLNPKTTYEFQARAYIRSTHRTADAIALYSSFSNTATATGIFTPPTNLVATSPSEGRVNLSWTDNSSAEGNYEIQVRIKGTTQWSVYDYVVANTTTLTNQLVAPGEILEFQVRATYGTQAEVGSNFTNIAEVTTTFLPPTNFTVTPSTTEPYRISFAWTDNSSVESEYELQYRKQGDVNYATRKLIASNGVVGSNSVTLPNLPEFDPGTVYEFRIRAILSASDGSLVSSSAFTPVVTATTKNGFSSKPYAPIKMGTPFSYQLATIGQQARTDWSVGTLPAGLSFDSATGIISGTPTVAGSFSVPLTANFTGGTSHVLNLALRILRPSGAPQIAAVITDQVVAPGASATVDLTTKFNDLDTESAVRMSTSKGNLDIVLYSSLTPGTVNNFTSYNYVNTIFHRAPAGFVMQGGGYTSFASPDVFESLTRQAAVANEPGISNTFGTVAMAKVGDDPNSATSEFFFSLGDNSINLDNQNGGFTVFGRLSAPSTNVLSAMAAVPTSNYAVKLRQEGVTPTSANFSFSNIPIDQTPVPTAIDQTKLLKILSITNIPILTYAITTPPDGAVATATLNGSNLEIHGVGGGSTSLVITVTDVDNNIAQQTVQISATKVPGTITLDSASLAQTYTGSALPVTVTTVPAGLGTIITYDGSTTAPTNAGSYAVSASINDTHYSGTTSGTLVISKAAATITLGGLARAYDGNPKPVTATTNPAGLTVGLTYEGSGTAPTNHGTYAVVATITDANHTGSQNGTLVISGQTAAEWRTQNFTPQQISAGLAADGADADGDGQTNLAEYALGTNPTASTSALGAPVHDANGLTLTFTRPKGLPNVIYGAEGSDNMVTWSPLTVELVTDGPVQTVRVRDPLTTGNPARRFIRLVFQSTGG